MKQLEFTRSAAKDLRRHGNVQARILKAMRDYAADHSSHANNITQLVGSTASRMRVGDYRVIFEETDTKIIVTKVAPRGGAYD